MPVETLGTLAGLVVAYVTRRRYLSDNYGAARTALLFLLVWFVSGALVHIAVIAAFAAVAAIR
jgi:hypothetical protein